MTKYLMKGPKDLVILFGEELRSFHPGEVIEANSTPHEWFEPLDVPVVAAPAPKVKLKKELTKATQSKLPADKF